MMKKIAKLTGCLARPAYRRALFMHRVAAGVEHGPVLRSIGTCRTVVDIGANRGQFALAARRSLPEARIVCFEPLPVPASIFRAVFANDARVTLHQVAIGPERSESTMHVSNRDDSSSLLPITDMQNSLFPGTYEAGTTIVNVGLLAEYLPLETIAPPALLKLDVQGFELQALQGCEQVLQHFSHVYVECSFVELYTGQGLASSVIAWLAQRSFELRGVYNLTQDLGGKAIQADFLFQNNPAGRST